MRICPKCLSVYGSSFTLYCQNDGEKTLDTVSIEAQDTCKRLIEKMKIEASEKQVRN